MLSFGVSMFHEIKFQPCLRIRQCPSAESAAIKAGLVAVAVRAPIDRATHNGDEIAIHPDGDLVIRQATFVDARRVRIIAVYRHKAVSTDLGYYPPTTKNALWIVGLYHATREHRSTVEEGIKITIEIDPLISRSDDAWDRPQRQHQIGGRKRGLCIVRIIARLVCAYRKTIGFSIGQNS